ncbi:DMT family transporter [Maricaulis sp.]|uniref:DMT family transporter n=1 Tax=Maricaulis sp. TaxID=1486257 RepID=UPI003A930189
MTHLPHHPTLRDWALLLVLTLLWGSAYAFIKHAVLSFSPAALIFVRISVAAALLTMWTYARGHRLPPLNDKRWLWFAALGLFGNTLPFFLISWGQQTIDSALTGILVATMPLTTIALAHVFVPGEQMNARRLAGFLLGFAGVVVLLGPVALRGLGGAGLVAQLAVLGAAVCYGINAVLARLLPDTSPSLSGAGMLIMGAVLALPFGVWDLAHMQPAPVSAWMNVLWLALGPTALASGLLMQIARTAGPSFLATVNYMTPIAAVATGLLIGETVGWNALLALAIILAGVWLARKKPVPPPV